MMSSRVRAGACASHRSGRPVGPLRPGPSFPAGTREAASGWSRIGVDDSPLRLDGVLAREQDRVAFHRVAEQALVGVHLAADVFARRAAPPRGRPSPRPASSNARRGRWRRRARGGSAHSSAARTVSPKRRARRRLQLDEHLGAGHRQALAGADVEGHAGPAQVVDLRAARPRRSRRANRLRRRARRGSRETVRARRPSGRSAGSPRAGAPSRRAAFRAGRPTAHPSPDRPRPAAGGSGSRRGWRRSRRRSCRGPRSRSSRPW